MTLSNRLKQIHQSMDTVSLFRPITKFSAEIDSADSVSEVVANAFGPPSRDVRERPSSVFRRTS